MIHNEKSNWVWSPSWNTEDAECPRIMLFRKVVEVKGKPQEGTIQISADTRYKLYINGRFVEAGPSRGDHHVWFYDTVSLLSWIKQGSNVLAVMVLRYPEDPAKGNHGMFRTSVPGLYVKGFLQDENGDVYDLSADESWRCQKDETVSFIREEVRFAPLIIHERAQGNPEILGWREENYDDIRWEAASPYTERQISETGCLENLRPRTIPFLYRKKKNFVGIMDIKKSVYTKEQWAAFLRGQEQIMIPAGSEEILEIDAGEEMTGYLRAAFCGGCGSAVQFLYSEAYVQDGVEGPEKIPVKGDRTDIINGHLKGYEDRYSVCGLGNPDMPETYEPFWFRAFRFLRLHITTGDEPLVLCSLDYEETGYPLNVETKVDTSDDSLKEIWKISERTLRRCMHETYEDCPFYEQLQYIMDARLQILYTYSVSADDRLARKCMDDLRRAQREDGLLNCSYPNCNVNVIPGFSIYYILMVYDHMMYFGDKNLVREHMPAIHRILQFFDRHLTPEGYVGSVGGLNRAGQFWSFIDWAREWNDTDGVPPVGKNVPITMESLLYIYGLQYAGKLAEYVEQNEKAWDYYARAEKVQTAVRKYCTGRDGMLQDAPRVEEYSQHCQVFGILTGTIDAGAGREILLRTVQDKSYTQCTVAMSFYLFRALEKTGLYALTNQYWDVWRKMIQNHCTTCVESEAFARSECHGWGALILYELPSTTLGVRPLEPGYKKVRIAPVPGYLTQASGTVKTPIGDISVSWEIKDGALSVDYRVLGGVEAETGRCTICEEKGSDRE